MNRWCTDGVLAGRVRSDAVDCQRSGGDSAPRRSSDRLPLPVAELVLTSRNPVMLAPPCRNSSTSNSSSAWQRTRRAPVTASKDVPEPASSYYTGYSLHRTGRRLTTVSQMAVRLRRESRTVGAQSVRALRTLPLESTRSELTQAPLKLRPYCAIRVQIRLLLLLLLLSLSLLFANSRPVPFSSCPVNKH